MNFQVSETQYKEPVSVTNIPQKTSLGQLNKLHATAAWSPDHFKSLPTSKEGRKASESQTRLSKQIRFISWTKKKIVVSAVESESRF